MKFNILSIVIALFMILSIVLIFWYAPVEKEMGYTQKIFYFHVPSAWISFLAFFVTFIGSIGYLRTRRDIFDVWAFSSAEIGLLFCTVALISGSIWAKGSWLTWWDWREPRLNTTLALWTLYAAYLITRTAFEGEQKRIYAAVIGIMSFVMVPIVYLSIRFWSSPLHPNEVVRGGLESRMLIAFFISLFTFTIFYVHLLLLRKDIEYCSRELEALQRESLEGREGWEEGNGVFP